MQPVSYLICRFPYDLSRILLSGRTSGVCVCVCNIFEVKDLEMNNDKSPFLRLDEFMMHLTPACAFATKETVTSQETRLILFFPDLNRLHKVSSLRPLSGAVE